MVQVSRLNWITGIFLVLILFLFWRRALSYRRPATHFRMLRLFSALLFLSLAGYQARWQLFGFLSADFLRVQRGFDARSDLIGNRFSRGDILDANGEVLAHDVKRHGKLIRSYPCGAAAAHVVGYHHFIFGSTGMEKALDATLMGRVFQNTADFFRLLLNAANHKNLHGNPVRLTIYKPLQEEAAKILGNRPGAIVAVDPRDGAVLALASSPSFDPDRLTRDMFERLKRNASSPFLNRALQGLYPPGSTFKPLVVLEALKKGLSPLFSCTPEGFSCGPGEPPVNDFEYYSCKQRHEKWRGHGKLDMDEALKVSCNVYFAQLGVKLGAKSLRHGALSAGFDAPVPPVEPGLRARPGKVPREDITLPHIARFAIGQDDLLVTPMHLALLAAAIGDQGVMYRPRYLKSARPKVWRRLTDSRYAVEVARKMLQVVEFGTGKAARVPGIIVGGKTGTAENASGKSHALFIGFAPWPQPVIAVCVVIEQGGVGGRVAAPAAARLFKKADELGLFDIGSASHDR